jgi:lysophospholipase L1-like esterase
VRSIRSLLGLAFVLSCLAAAGAVPVASASAASSRAPQYLALGDSVPVWNGIESYPYRILARYQRQLHHLSLDDIAVSGETTTSMLEGGQYQAALRFLRAHRRHVALITIDIGGNDVVGCVGPAGIDEQCATQARATIKRNLGKMLAGLRAAAPRVPLFGMTYYNPFLGDWLAGGAARALTLATTPGLLALNRELTQIYGGAKRTADVQTAFRATDFKTIVPSPWGDVPIGVKRACTWLDIGCHPGALEDFGDDPNLAGAAVIASAFERKIGVLSTPGRARRTASR